MQKVLAEAAPQLLCIQLLGSSDGKGAAEQACHALQDCCLVKALKPNSCSPTSGRCGEAFLQTLGTPSMDIPGLAQRSPGCPRLQCR